MITRTDANYNYGIGGTSAYANAKTDHAQKSSSDEGVSFKKILEDTFERSNAAAQTSATYTRAQAGGNVHHAQTESEKNMSATSTSLSDVAWQTIFDDEKEDEDESIANLNNGRTDVAKDEESSEEEEVIEDDETKLKKLYYISQSGDKMLLITTEDGEVIKRRNLGPALSMNEATGLSDLTDAQILSDAENMTLSSLAGGAMF